MKTIVPDSILAATLQAGLKIHQDQLAGFGIDQHTSTSAPKRLDKRMPKQAYG